MSVDVFEGLPRGTESNGIESDNELENRRKEGTKNESSCNILNTESHFDVQENGEEVSSLQVKEEENQTPHSGFSKRAKPGFTRSVSLQHWHVKADIQHLTPIHLTCTFPPFYPVPT